MSRDIRCKTTRRVTPWGDYRKGYRFRAPLANAFCNLRPGVASLLVGLLVSMSAGRPATTHAQAPLDEISSCRGGEDRAPRVVFDDAMSSGRPDVQALRELSRAYPHDLRVLFLLAEAENAAGESLRATAAAKAAFAEDPACRPVAVLLGELLEAGGDYSAAAAVYREAVEAHQDDVQLQKRLCRAWVSAGALVTAEQCLDGLVQALQDDAEVLAGAAEVAGWQGKAEKAVTLFERAVELDPSVMGASRYRTYGDALRSMGRHRAALEQYARALAIDEHDLGASMGRGWALLALDRAGEAVSAFRDVLAEKADSAEGQAGLARALYAAGRGDEAADAYEKALALAPDDVALRREAVQVIASLPAHRMRALECLQPLLQRPAPAVEDQVLQARILSWIPEKRREALNVLANVLAASPEDASAWQVARDIALWSPPSAEWEAWLGRLHSHFPEDHAITLRFAEVLARNPDSESQAAMLVDRVLNADPRNVEAMLLKAERLSRQAPSPDEARALFSRAAALAPDDPEIQARAGRGLLALRDAEAALACFTRGSTANPHDVPCLLGRARALVALHRVEEATVLLSDAADAANSPEDRTRLVQQLASVRNLSMRRAAEKLEKVGRIREAEALYRAIVQKSPDDADTWVALGGLLAHQNRYPEALKCFEHVLSRYPDHVGALRGAAGAHVALGRFDAAERLLQKAIHVSPSPEVRQALTRVRMLERIAAAQTLEREGDVDGALAMLSALYLDHPDQVEVVLAYAEVLGRAGRVEAAGEAYQHAATLDPQNIQAWQGAATFLWKAGRHEEARKHLEQVRRLSGPEGARSVDDQRLAWEVEEAEAEKARGHWSAALAHYRNAYSMDPTRDFVLMGIGGLYWNNGQVDLASKFYVQAARLHPDDVHAFEAAVETLLDRELPEVALSLIQVGLQSHEDSRLRRLLEKASLERDLAVIVKAWDQGEGALAAELSEQLERRYPRDVEARLRLAERFAARGRHDQAVRWYYKALEIDPEQSAALLGLIASLQTMRRFEEADDLIRQARKREATTGNRLEGLDRLEAAGLAVEAEVHRRRGQVRGAFDAYVRAVELGFREPWLLLNIARLYQTNGQPTEALHVADAVLRQVARNVEALRIRAWALLALKKTGALAQTIDQIEEITLPMTEDRILRAELEKLRGNLEGALHVYRDLADTYPQDPDVLKGLVGCLLARGAPAEALDVMGGRVALIVDDPALLDAAASALSASARSDLAVPVLRRLNRYWGNRARAEQLDAARRRAYIEAAERSKVRGDLSSARRLYEAALRLWPDAADLWKGLAGVEASAGEFDDAIQDYEKALDREPEDAVARSGLAAARAGRGEVLSAIRALQDAWQETHDVEVGLVLAELLVSQGRFAEAENVIDAVAEVMGVEGKASDSWEGETAGTGEGDRSKTAAAARFFDAWRATPKGVPAVRGAEGRREALPAWVPSQDVDRDAQASPGIDVVAASGRVILPDIAPELPYPEQTGANIAKAPAAGPGTSSETGTRLDLRLVEALLSELQHDPGAVVEGAMAAKPDGADERADVHGWQGFAWPEDVGTDPVADENEPFVPSTGDLSSLSARGIEPLSPRARLEALRRKAAAHRAPRFQTTGWMDTRSGEPGTTQRLALFASVRARFHPIPAFYLEPFVSPGMVTDGVNAAQGVRPGLAFGLRPGRFALAGVLGTSALGLPADVYPAGRVTASLDLADRLNLAVEGAVEPIEDTFLSWVGWYDQATGRFVGKVYRSRLGGAVNLLLDGDTNLSLGADLGRYAGSSVDENTWRNGRLSVQHRVRLDSPGRLKVGMNVTAFGFEKQLDGFTFSSSSSGRNMGGYFSPRLFVVAKARGVYSEAEEARFRYHVALELGAQYTVCQESAMCTLGLDPAFVFELGASYALSEGLWIGAGYRFDNVGVSYRHQFIDLYLQKRFGRR